MSVQQQLEQLLAITSWQPDVEYPLDVIHEGFRTTLLISRLDHMFQITLPSTDPYDPCLRILIFGETAYIDSVTTEPNCRIPQQHGGSWMMRLTNSLLCRLGVKEARLDDDARMLCGGRPKIIFLRIFQGRLSGWYQNFGYEPSFYEQEPNRILALETMRQLRELPAQQLYTESVESIQPNYKIYPEVLAELRRKYPPGEMNLGDYMMSVWQHNCTDYSRLEAFVRFTNGSWAPLVQSIEGLSEGINRNLCRR